jgi:hypothetical protein
MFAKKFVAADADVRVLISNFDENPENMWVRN